MDISRSVITVICDSLRRDLLSARHTPTLWRLMQAGTQFVRARGVFPSTTRTSAASIATGCFPAAHGLRGNCVVLRESSGLACHNVGDPAFRDRLRQITGATLQKPVLAELVGEGAGAFIMSNVSAGAAYFHDPDGYGEVYHRAGSYGPGCRPIVPDPMDGIRSGAAGDAAMTALFIERLRAGHWKAATLWLSEPDHSGHRHALGSPGHLEGIANADQCVARVIEVVEALRKRGEDVLLIVASDHGMQSIVETVPVTRLMVDAGLKLAEDSRELVIAPNGTAFTIGLDDSMATRIPAIVAWLGMQPWVGDVFYGSELASLGLADCSECRIAVTMAADEAPNAYGVPGRARYIEDPDEPGDYGGRGQHGGLGAYEQKPFLIVQGDGFPAGTSIDEEVSLVDFLPTALTHLRLPIPACDGRPLQLLASLGRNVPAAELAPL